jgi:TonB family protein
LIVPTETTQAAEYSSKNNRRFYSRREVRSLAYIDLGQDNGGIVLNLSEGGLAIHSAIMLTDRRLPHIRLQLPQSANWVEARGEIAWTSETRRQAGIQLIGLGDEARRQIREWVNNRGAASARPTQAVSATESRPANSPPAYAMPMPRAIDNSPAAANRDLPSWAKSSGNGHQVERSATTSVPSIGSPSNAAETTTSSAIAKPAEIYGRNPGTELGLRLGATAPSKSRPAWMAWTAAGAFLAGMAAISFFAGLSTGRGNFRSSVARLWRGDLGAGTVSAASQQSPGLAIARRVTITSRMYVPVAIPTPFDAAKTNRLQVGAIESRIDPPYPEDAAARRVEGTVQLHATIAADGSVENVAGLSGPPPLVLSAANAVRQWRFKPTLLDGKPIETEADIAIVFWLQPPSSASDSQ